MRIDSVASGEIRDIVHYYERERIGLGIEFLDEVDRTLALIAAYPRAYATVRNQTRRAGINRFPYALFYRIEEGQVVVIGCVHGKRHPTTWESRT